MNLLEASSRAGEDGYPPYNIEKKGDNDYRITMAVAGFGEDDLAIEVKDGTVTVSGSVHADGDKERTYLHRGIAGRSFRRAFQLADHVHVSAAALENGLLHIDLVREVPEALKPRNDQDFDGPGPAPDRESAPGGLTPPLHPASGRRAQRPAP